MWRADPFTEWAAAVSFASGVMMISESLINKSIMWRSSEMKMDGSALHPRPDVTNDSSHDPLRLSHRDECCSCPFIFNWGGLGSERSPGRPWKEEAIQKIYRFSSSYPSSCLGSVVTSRRRLGLLQCLWLLWRFYRNTIHHKCICVESAAG